MRKTILILLPLFFWACSTSSNSQVSNETTLPDYGIAFREPGPYLKSFLDNDSLGYTSTEHNNFKIYAKENSYTSEHLALIKFKLDTAMRRVFEVLQLKSYPYGIHLFAVDSEDEMEKLMGRHIKGGAAPGHDLIFFVFNEKIRPYFEHELFHLVAFESWGPPAGRLLDEGGATFCDNVCFYENPMYTINAGFKSQDKWMELDDLIYNFNDMASENDVVAYIQSAGYFKYLYENHGVQKMKELWKRGFAEFEEIYGFDLEELEGRWLKTIEQVKVPKDFDYQLLMREGCG